MHDYSIKLLAVVEGPRELGDDDGSPHYCQANDRIRCMTKLTAGGDKSAGKKKKTQEKYQKKRNIRHSLEKMTFQKLHPPFSFI